MGSPWREAVEVSASVGIASFPDDGDDAEEILLAADRACFVAKRRGRGAVATATEGRALAGEFTLSEPTPVDRRLTRRQRPPVTRIGCTSQSGRAGAVRPSLDPPASTLASAVPRRRSRRPAAARERADRAPDADAVAHADAGPDPDADARPADARRPAPSFTAYTVTRGDTLTSIARRFKTDARSIAYWNRDRYPALDPESARLPRRTRIQRGWVLQILPDQEYVRRPTTARPASRRPRRRTTREDHDPSPSSERPPAP